MAGDGALALAVPLVGGVDVGAEEEDVGQQVEPGDQEGDEANACPYRLTPPMTRPCDRTGIDRLLRMPKAAAVWANSCQRSSLSGSSRLTPTTTPLAPVQFSVTVCDGLEGL